MNNTVRVKVVYRRDKQKYVLRWTDPFTRMSKEKSTAATSRREADRLAGELQSALLEGRHNEPCRLSWDDFRTAYETQRCVSFKKSSQAAYASTLNHVERLLRPVKVSEVNTPACSRLQTQMRSEGLSEATIARHLRHLKAVLNWGSRVGLLAEVPKIVMPRRARRTRQMRGRPLQEPEKDMMLSKCVEVREEDYADWQEFIEGLWLSGLRLGEALALGWDEGSLLSIDLGRKRPALHVQAEGEKGFQDRLIPLTPDFARFAQGLYLPNTRRVFALGRRGLSQCTVGRVISKIGKATGITVNAEQSKYASAHDLRRSFGTRWASKVKPVVLKDLMRHSSVTTTLTYYVSLDCDEVAESLWAQEPEETR